MRKKMYVPKGVTTNISADIKMTVNIRNDYYSVTGHEERVLPENEDVNLELEWQDLYDELYTTVHDQIQEIKNSLKKKR